MNKESNQSDFTGSSHVYLVLLLLLAHHIERLLDVGLSYLALPDRFRPGITLRLLNEVEV